jgi:hypothetical protein
MARPGRFDQGPGIPLTGVFFAGMNRSDMFQERGLIFLAPVIRAGAWRIKGDRKGRPYSRNERHGGRVVGHDPPHIQISPEKTIRPGPVGAVREPPFPENHLNLNEKSFNETTRHSDFSGSISIFYTNPARVRQDKGDSRIAPTAKNERHAARWPGVDPTATTP